MSSPYRETAKSQASITFSLPRKKYLREADTHAPAEVHEYGYGRWSCPACGKWRLTAGRAIQLGPRETFENFPAQPFKESEIDGVIHEWVMECSWCLARACERCGYKWYTQLKI